MSNQLETNQTVSTDVGMKVAKILKDKALSEQVALTRKLKLILLKANLVMMYSMNSPTCLANISRVQCGHFNEWERDDEWNIPL